MPKVSVVIPNYNHARFLRQRLRTVLGQTFQDFEVLFLDDASTDDSVKVLAEFPDPRIRFIGNEVNSGSPFKQWNKGVANARGEYVWIAESDDYADPALLETLVERLDSHPAAGIAYCQSWAVDEHGTTLFSAEELTRGIDSRRWRQDFVVDGREECARYLIFQNSILNASAVLFRREVFVQAGAAEESLRLAGDWLTWARMLFRSDLVFVARPLNYHRFHPGSVRERSSSEQVAEERWKVRRRIIEEIGFDPLDLLRVRGMLTREWSRLALRRVSCSLGRRASSAGSSGPSLLTQARQLLKFSGRSIAKRLATARPADRAGDGSGRRYRD